MATHAPASPSTYGQSPAAALVTSAVHPCPDRLRTLVGEFEHERAVRIELQALLERERAAELHALRRRADEQAALLHALRAELARAGGAAGAEGLEMIDARIAEIGKPERAAAAGAGARLGASLESAVRWLRDARPGHLL